MTEQWRDGMNYDQTRAHHALILSAYIGNLPPIVLDQIIKASRASWAEALNGTLSSQAQAQANEREVIRAAIDTITDTGILSIERTIEGGRA
jgi:hypothetical protein